MQVLIVDNDSVHLDLLDRALANLGHAAVRASGGQEALKLLREGKIRLLISDWDLEGMDGLQFCSAVRQEDFSAYIYIILLNRQKDTRAWRQGMNAGADACLSKPLDVEELEVCLKTAERILSLGTPAASANRSQILAAPRGILVVEDSPMTQKMLVKLLGQTGQPVQAVGTAEAAMEIIVKCRPALIVSDLEMPGASGLDLCRNLRGLTKLEPTHFIMLTGLSSEQQMLEAYSAGVNDFVLKPYNPDELLAKVRVGLRSIELQEQLEEKAHQLQDANSSLAKLNNRLGQLSITDDLTGLFNRRHAMVRLEEQWVLSKRYSRLLTVAVVDIDFFKTVNDTYGHDAGDRVLRQVAEILKEQTRTTDAVCRVGGEEFLIIFPSETIQEALVCCQRCRTAVEGRLFEIGDTCIRVTISIGVATRIKTTADFPDLLQEADKALYEAKEAGRNRVCTADARAAEPVNAAIHEEPRTVLVRSA